MFDQEQTYNLFKNKILVIGQIQSIFDEMHTGKALSQGCAVGFKNKYQIQMDQTTEWVQDNKDALGTMAYKEAMGTIKFFQFINTKAGLSDILKGPTHNFFFFGNLYQFNPPNLEIASGIPYHYHTTREEDQKALNSLFSQFILSLNLLKTDNQKTQFFKELNGLCIEAKTSNAFIYAASLKSNPEADLEPFHVIADKYRDEAHEALKGQVLTIDLLAHYINDNHGGEKCLSDKNLCPSGVISFESAKAFLEITDFDLI